MTQEQETERPGKATRFPLTIVIIALAALFLGGSIAFFILLGQDCSADGFREEGSVVYFCEKNFAANYNRYLTNHPSLKQTGLTVSTDRAGYIATFAH